MEYSRNPAYVTESVIFIDERRLRVCAKHRRQTTSMKITPLCCTV